VFYLNYVVSELRRRTGRTLLTALGLGVGVGLVVAVSALSTGLDRAQDKVLEPLTGVGTDMSVTRPLEISGEGDVRGGQGLSPEEREKLEEENGNQRLDLSELGDPGDKFTNTRFMSTSQLSFPDDEVSEIAGIDGVQDAAGSLTLSAVTISGTVPEGGVQGGLRGGGGGGGGDPDQDIEVDSSTVTGIDQTKPDVAAVNPDQVTEGRYLADDDKHEAVLNVAYAQRKGIEVGDKVELGDHNFTVVGLAQSPLGGQASDAYVKLDQLQAMSDREGRVNTVQVRADSSEAVAGVERAIPGVLESASVTTAADLADRVGGSLVDAKNLAGKLGTALTIVALVAAFLIASLLTLSSVNKRIRELGTLKAIGWPQRLVVRQVTGESLTQGALGGVIGALIGIGGAALINAVGPTLTASVAQASTGGGAGGPGGGPLGGGGGFGRGQITSGSTEVALDAPVDFGLIVLAISLALLGGLIAGSAGGLRAARLRPADALRHID
jgi:ABC-type antimicrobial peptide transport system permease subunit